MPLRDHFRSPLDDQTAWEGFHGGWPMVIVQSLVRKLPRGYVAAPPETFSTGFFEQTETGIAPVADSAVIEASLAILAKRVARGSVLSSPSAESIEST